MKMKTVLLPEASLQGLYDLVREGYYPNVSEAIREAIKDLLEFHRSLKEEPKHAPEG